MIGCAVLLLVASTAGAGSIDEAQRHWELSRAYLERGMVRHAFAEARVTLKLDPAHAQAREFLNSRGNGAVNAAPEALYSAAREAYRESRTERARRLCAEVVKEDRDHEGARALLAALDEEIYRPVPLIPNELLKEIFDKGVTFYRREEWEAAMEMFRTGLASAPAHEQFRLFFGRVRERAEASQIERLVTQARAAHEGGRHPEAQDALVRILAIRPDHAEALSLRDEWGFGPDAEERRAKAKDHFNRGVAAYELGRWADAIGEWRRVLELTPEDEEAGRLLERARAKDEASKKEAKKRAAELHREALRLYQQGKRDEARRLYEKILEMVPDDEQARRNLALIEGGE